MDSVTRIFDLLPHYIEHFKEKEDALAFKEQGEWKKYDIHQYTTFANYVSYGLLKLGVRKGDRIASISNNRPEWNFLDMGLLQIGAVHIPIYPTISEEEYKYILNHAEIKFVFVSARDLYRKIERVLPDITKLEGVYSFDLIENVSPFGELLDLGKNNPETEKLSDIKATINPEDIATIIYTSGTTGVPKGVILSHSNILSNAYAVIDIIPIDQYSISLSYLPLCHIYERTNIYSYHLLGTTIYYAENMATIIDNMKEISPHILTTVPRLLEKIFDRILIKGRNLKGIKRFMFFWALNLAMVYNDKGKSIIYKIQHWIADKLIFYKWRMALGGNMRVIVSGGAALQERLGRIFTAAGIPVLEGYGLTETSPVIAVNTFEKNGRMFGTVGKPIVDVTVKIANDGEILCKGPNVMQGYYKDEEMTKDVIDADGWFHTGDMGVLEPEGHLRITGRKKEIFKTSFGKYISPQLIENKFKESPFIDSLIVVGENQKFAAALIVPDFDYLKSWCEMNDIPYHSDKEIIQDQKIKKVFQKEVDNYNSLLGVTEQVKKFEMIDHEWSIESGELTASLKIKRNYITGKYQDVIDGIFDIKRN